MFKKTILAIIIGALCASTLVGCGAKTSTDSATATKTPIKEVSLKFMGYKAGKEQGAIPDVITKYQAANPNIKVEYEGISDSSNYTDVLKARLASGGAADLFMVHNKQEAVTFSTGNYLSDLSSESWVSNMNTKLKDINVINDKTYMLPLEMSGVCLIANKDLLAKNSIANPTNWNEFMDACAKLKAVNATPLLLAMKTGWPALVYGMFADGDISLTQPKLGADLVSGKIKASDVYLPYMKKFQMVIDKGYTNGELSLGMEFDNQGITEFVKGNAGFYIGGTWMIPQLKTANANFNFDMIPFPINESGTSNAYIFPGANIAINAKSKNLDEAKKFLKFWSEDANGQLYTKSQAAFSPMKGGTSSDAPEVKIYGAAVSKGSTVFGWNGQGDVNIDRDVVLTKWGEMAVSKKAGNISELGKQLNDAVTKGVALKK